MTSVSQMITGATTDTFYLEPTHPRRAGRSPRSICAPKRGALIIAVVRGGMHHLGPDADFTLREGTSWCWWGSPGARSRVRDPESAESQSLERGTRPRRGFGEGTARRAEEAREEVPRASLRSYRTTPPFCAIAFGALALAFFSMTP